MKYLTYLKERERGKEERVGKVGGQKEKGVHGVQGYRRETCVSNKVRWIANNDKPTNNIQHSPYAFTASLSLLYRFSNRFFSAVASYFDRFSYSILLQYSYRGVRVLS